MFRRIRARIYRWKHQPTKQELNHISEHYRNMILDNKAVELITSEGFDNLIKVAKYADFGRSTAIQAAFCLEHLSGQQELKDKINKHFIKGDAE